MLTFIVIFIVLIFPLFLSIKTVYCFKQKKLFFGVYLFSIKILGGYVELVADGIAIHVTKKKAFLILYKNLIKMRVSVKPLQDYHFIKFKVYTDIGIKQNILPILSCVFFFDYVWQSATFFLKTQKTYITFENNINVYEGEPRFNVYIDTTILLNVLMIMISLIKIFVEKIVYGISKRKQNKSNN